MDLSSRLRANLLAVAQPRARTLNMAMTPATINAANGAHATWGIDTELVLRATRGHFDDLGDNSTDIDRIGTGGLLS